MLSNQDPNNIPPTAQTEQGSSEGLTQTQEGWEQLARDAYHNSTTYIDNNLRKRWEDGLRAFNSQHAAESKFNSPTFDKRSKLYRPKIRTISRKIEAAAAAAFFSSTDTVSVEASDPNNKQEQAGAEVMKEILQYRLTKNIKWFHTILGGVQDAQNTGVVCAHAYWDYIPAAEAVKVECGSTEEHADKEETSEEYPAQESLPDGSFAVEEEGFVDVGMPGVGAPNQNPEEAPLGLAAAPAPQQEAQATSPQEEQATPQKIGNQPAEPQQPEVAAPPPLRVGPKPISDQPRIDLVPVENIRIDIGADWTNPIESSPFVIHLIPMYYMDVKAKMDSGEWFSYGAGYVKAATGTKYDSTRVARQQAADQYMYDGAVVEDYTICWVHRHIHRRDGVDWEFYMLADYVLLSDPRPLKESVLHGRRPYVMGCCVIETHKLYPSSFYALSKNLVDEANEIANQRIDNVKFVLNKKYLVKAGANQDLAGLVRNVPGGVVVVNDPQTDVKELTWPDVTASSYEEQTRIDNDMSDLLGNFSAAQVMADHGVNGPAHNMAMLGQSAGTLTEYTLRTFVETFVQPLLRQLVLLEQYYETDQVVMALASKKANLFEKFGVSEITDQLLEQELTLNVNVGMGATDPQLKVQKFMAGITMFANIAKEPPMGLNMQEVGKELFGHLGYSDGSRFFTNDNPQVAQMTQQLQQAMMEIKRLKAQVDVKMMGHQVKEKVNETTNKTKLAIAKQHEENENLRTGVTQKVSLVNAEKDRVHAIVMHRLESGLAHVNHVRGMAMKESNGKPK